MPRITKEPEERRQEIIDTAMRLFYEKGYEKTSITDIASSMGVAQGLCYRYFPSKEDIFDSALEQYAQSQVNKMTAGFTDSGHSLRQIIMEMPTFMDIETDDSFYYKVCHNEQGMKTHYQLSVKICKKLMPIVESLLDKAVERKEIKPVDTQAAASFCVFGQMGILLNQSMGGEERVKRTKEFLLNILDLM